ncbi:MAG TPA: type I restriction endonuclease [Clostridia bacterium]|nr:type I restriction endonuclease [Clostridia bacterium]
MFTPPNPADLSTESDVEQKFAFPLLTAPPPHGLGIAPAEIFTKPNIQEFRIGKGTSSKLYYPDYIATILGLPVVIVEAKKPAEDLQAAAGEARLYAAELNARYPAGVNPCKFCIVTNGFFTHVRSWDSDDILAQFGLTDVGSVSPAFGEFCRVLSSDSLRSHAAQIHATLRPVRYFRALDLVGGRTVQNEQIAFNDFGRVLAANFQSIFDPASYEDRIKIVRNAYVGSPRKDRYISEIDRIIRNASPTLVQEASLIEDPAEPSELAHRFQDLPSLRNKILLLVGSVGAGKSTFVDYLRDRGLPQPVSNQTAWLRIDLNPAPLTAAEIYPWLRRQIVEGIRAASPEVNTFSLDNLKKLYRQKVREFEEGEGSLFAKDSEQYATRLADLLSKLKDDEALTIQCLEQFLCTGRGRLLVIVLDNCDKRDRDQQLLMFQVAKYIQQEIRCLVILPLRHETFENHRHEPPLDTALKDMVYRIEPPSFHEVLKRRLGLVVKEAKQMGPRSLSYNLGGKTIEFPVEKLERFLHAMMGSLFDHKQYGRKIIVGLAGWNIRKAFEIFLEFCRSGFIKEEDIFERQVATGDLANLPRGVVAKVLLRTSRRYYDGDESFVKNLFQSDLASSRPCAFLRYWILAWLRSRGWTMGPSGVKGYHRLGDLVRDLLTIGADPDNVRSEVRYLARAGCLLPEHLRADSIKDGDLIRITPSGHVHLELAHRDLNYLAACSEDSWMTQFKVADDIRDRITQQPFWRGLSWANTLANARGFSEYLKALQENSINAAPYLPPTRVEPEKVDFDKILNEISSHHQRGLGYQASPSTTSNSDYHPAQETD